MFTREGKSLGTCALMSMGFGVVSAFFFPGIFPVLFIAGGIATMALSVDSHSKYDMLWKNLKLCYGEVMPVCKKITKKDNETIYHFTVPAGLSLKKFNEHLDAIEMYAGCPVELEAGFKEIILRELPRRQQEAYEYEPTHIKGRVPIMIGYNKDGKLISCDLGSGEPHMLVAGTSGGGKSTALRAIITNLITDAPSVGLYLIDLKNGVEFNIFRNCESVRGFARNPEDALKMLRNISDEVDRRYDLFFAAGCVDIASYNRTHTPLEYRLLIIDEFATLMYDTRCLDIIESLTAKARACGCHLLLSTQRPDNKVLNGRIKANVTTILGLKTTDDTNSMIVIDRPGLERLRGKGHGIFKFGGDEVMVQCPRIEPDRARDLVAPFTRKEAPPKTEEPAELAGYEFMEGYKDANIKRRTNY